MPITHQNVWDHYQQSYDDTHIEVISTARRTMQLLDEDPGEIDPYRIVSAAAGDGGLDLLSWDFVVQIVCECHSRGEEFRVAWNKIFDPEPQPGILSVMDMKEKK